MNKIKVVFPRGTTEPQLKSTKREDQKVIWIKKTTATVLKETLMHEKNTYKKIKIKKVPTH